MNKGMGTRTIEQWNNGTGKEVRECMHRVVTGDNVQGNGNKNNGTMVQGGREGNTCRGWEQVTMYKGIGTRTMGQYNREGRKEMYAEGGNR